MSKRLTACLMLSTALCSTSARSQAPGGFGPPGGGFGPPMGMGGPGFGAGEDATPIALMRMPAVRDELKLDDKQLESVDRELQKFDEEFRSSFGVIDFPNLQTLNDDERKNQYAEARKIIDKATESGNKAIVELLRPEQAKRLDQLALQRQSARAF